MIIFSLERSQLGSLDQRVRAFEQSVADLVLLLGDDPVPMRLDETDEVFDRLRRERSAP